VVGAGPAGLDTSPPLFPGAGAARIRRRKQAVTLSREPPLPRGRMAAMCAGRRRAAACMEVTIRRRSIHLEASDPDTPPAVVDRCAFAT